ncbi:predicted protein [Sclerotinia sclerotiorum 1980 UF-70]|uniref:Uncharacterized protein n=1 Tax=Sclerotinia sclerotiorum (strain ATCC 18683 / 1980 / Ss-1) TaxID=665079 RepID=A7EB53_SCLS1|nr:predicted protein [Sclerotinia sclerotiorum 1980 UF-70]EDN99681.1 predicted protein [Sclerotinia sclerotiorum 1980 UF-70]
MAQSTAGDFKAQRNSASSHSMSVYRTVNNYPCIK